MAFLNPLEGGRTLSVEFIHRCLESLASQGFGQVITGVLAPLEQVGFLGAGFEVEERLCVLSCDLGAAERALGREQIPSGIALRKLRDNDITDVLAIDRLAFAPFWQIDQSGLAEAREATPRSRFRLALEVGQSPVGYAITGIVGHQGFLQRLAVHPHHQANGIGKLLVADGMRWLRRWRVGTALVNTQHDNISALKLYQSLGFRPEPHGLSVLSAGIQR